jgi:hypothetical protein
MKTLKFKIEGVCPLLQHDDKTANPFNDYTKELKAISGKRKKTEDDLLEMARIEWSASLYHTEKKGYYMKAECFEASLLAAAKSKKLGTAFKQAVRIPDDPIFHFKDENKTPKQLFAINEYKDFRTVKVMTSKVLRCRPIFNEWYCEIELWYDESRIDEGELIQIAEYAGRFIGICDYRPKFGRFSATRI